MLLCVCGLTPAANQPLCLQRALLDCCSRVLLAQNPRSVAGTQGRLQMLINRTQELAVVGRWVGVCGWQCWWGARSESHFSIVGLAGQCECWGCMGMCVGLKGECGKPLRTERL